MEKENKQRNAEEIKEERRLLLKRWLTSGALERLKRIEMVKPEKSQRVEDYILANGMRLAGGAQITEAQLINLLEQLADSGRVNVQIKRKADEQDDWDW